MRKPTIIILDHFDYHKYKPGHDGTYTLVRYDRQTPWTTKVSTLTWKNNNWIDGDMNDYNEQFDKTEFEELGEAIAEFKVAVIKKTAPFFVPIIGFLDRLITKFNKRAK